MTLTLEQVEHVAELAKLSLTAEEKERYRKQLSAILEYAEMIRELDTDTISPTAQVVARHHFGKRAADSALCNVMAPDEPAPSLPVEDALANAPQRMDNHFRVPKVLEEHTP